MIEPPGEGGGEEVEGVPAGRQPPGDGRHEVLDRRRPLEPPEARDADAPGPADPAEIVAQDIDDHRVLGAVLAGLQQFRGERAILATGSGHGAGSP